MRDRVREPALTSLLASKRFVVSVCAAIAMVLGAVSAGASVFTGSPTDARQPEMPANAVFKETPGSPSASSETPLFTKRQTLASQNIAVQPPLYTSDTAAPKEKKGLNLKLNSDVVKTTNVLFYNPVGQPLVTDTMTPIAPADSTTPVSTETSPAASSTEVPTQPTTIEPQDPATATPPTPTDPTTESSLNSTAPQPSDEIKQQ